MRSCHDVMTMIALAVVMTLTRASIISTGSGQLPSGFGKAFHASGLQGWNDWVQKRPSEFGTDPWSSPGDLQQWSDWMNKRNFGSHADMGTKFGSPTQFQNWVEWVAAKRDMSSGSKSQLSNGQFQGWSDWLNKRGLNSGSKSPFSNGQFQGWSDWLNKRGLDSGLKSPFSNGQFQGWSDWLNKRGQNSGSKSPFSNGQFQGWSDWLSKRNWDAPEQGFGREFMSPTSFQSWGDYSKRHSPKVKATWIKRDAGGHLKTSRGRFGSARYFREGQQDSVPQKLQSDENGDENTKDEQ